MVCPNCGSQNVSIQAVAEQKKRGCLSVLLIIILLLIPIIGWIALIILLRGRKSTTVTYALCQNCGNRWVLNGAQNPAAMYPQPQQGYQQQYPQQGYQQPDQSYTDQE